MKNTTLILLLFCIGFFACKQEEKPEEAVVLTPQELIKENIQFSELKYKAMVAENSDTQKSPRATDPDGSF